jgi:hypothetical protein
MAGFLVPNLYTIRPLTIGCDRVILEELVGAGPAGGPSGPAADRTVRS